MTVAGLLAANLDERVSALEEAGGGGSGNGGSGYINEKISIHAFVVLGGGVEYFKNLFFLTLCFRYNCLPYCVDYL